jgi:predicted dehydrogenase
MSWKTAGEYYSRSCQLPHFVSSGFFLLRGAQTFHRSYLAVAQKNPILVDTDTHVLDCTANPMTPPGETEVLSGEHNNLPMLQPWRRDHL